MQPVKSHRATVASALVAVVGTVATAHAADETFVSDSGSNDNTCTSIAAACRELTGATGALAKTTEGGLIHVLPGHYTYFIIDKAIEIIADGGQAANTSGASGIPGGGFAQIVVNAGPDDEVRIRGFILDGGPIGLIVDTHGVVFLAGGALHLEDCTLVNADGSFGVAFRPSGTSELYVSNCVISGNGSAFGAGGIEVRPTAGSGSAKITIDNVRVENNAAGILVDGRTTTGSNTGTVRDSTISGNTSFGLFAADSGGGVTEVAFEGSSSSNNGSFGIGASGANATVRVKDSTVIRNANGLVAAASSKIISLGGNSVTGNTTNGAFTSSLPLQ